MENEEKGLILNDFSELQEGRDYKKRIYTNIEDEMTIFNLETAVDFKLNECKGEKIRVKGILIKVYEKPLKEPELDDETGEIIKEKETKMVTILIDEKDKSYVTGSKMFTIQMINYLEMFGWSKITEEGLEIEITERSVTNSQFKALAFKLIK